MDEPTLTVTFRVNTSPFAGREGKFLTARQIEERLLREASHNVALRVRRTSQADCFEVSGRGELHLSVLIETMRREGYELAVSQPEVIVREEAGVRLEPYESVAFEVDAEHQGRLMEALGERKGELLDVDHDGPGAGVRLAAQGLDPGADGLSHRVRVVHLRVRRHDLLRGGLPPSAGGTGHRTEIRGADLESHRRPRWAMRCSTSRTAGALMVAPGDEVYEGMVVGVHSRANDLTVNPLKEKKLTNIRAAGSDENILLTPPLRLTLEQALEFIDADELIEVTPESIRIRKMALRENQRRRA